MADEIAYESQRAVCKRTRAFKHAWQAGTRLARAGVAPEAVTERTAKLARAFVARHCQTLSERCRARFCLTYGEVALDAYAAARGDSLAMQRTYRPVGP